MKLVATLALALTACSSGGGLPAGDSRSGFVVGVLVEWESHPFGQGYGNHPPSLEFAAVSGRTAVVAGFGATSATSSTGYLWQSPDGGVTWRAGVTGLPTEGIGGTVAALAVAGSSLIAVGTEGGIATVWRSGEGQAWQRLTGPERRGAFDSVAVRGDKVVVVGADGAAAFVAVVRDGSWRVLEPPRDLPERTAFRLVSARTDDVLLVTTSCLDSGECKLLGWVTTGAGSWRAVALPTVDAAAVQVLTEGNKIRLVAAGTLYASQDVRHRDDRARG